MADLNFRCWIDFHLKIPICLGVCRRLLRPLLVAESPTQLLVIAVGAESEDLCDLFVLLPLQIFLVFLLLGGVSVELYPTDFAVVELTS